MKIIIAHNLQKPEATTYQRGIEGEEDRRGLGQDDWKTRRTKKARCVQGNELFSNIFADAHTFNAYFFKVYYIPVLKFWILKTSESLQEKTSLKH